jgi:hypothetical protein
VNESESQTQTQSESPFDTATIRADLLVAGTSAAATVGLSVVLAFALDAAVGPLWRLSPIFVYFLYLLLGKGDTGSAFEDPRLWAGLAVVAAAGVLALAVVG